MVNFFRTFLLDDARRLNASDGRQILLAAFGKHPGWDDHIEDIGMESETLVAAKGLLYVQGIGGQIDSGAWDKLQEDKRLSGFGHVFFWHRPGQFLLGRLWSSTDGKGRSRYPMLVCAHVCGLPIGWGLDKILPRLEQLEQACKKATSAEEVRSSLARHLRELRFDMEDAGSEAATESRSLVEEKELLERIWPDGAEEGLARILYQMCNQMSAYAPGRLNAKSDEGSLLPQQIRVPTVPGTVAQSILLWLRFFRTQVDSGTPLLLLVPVEEAWTDVTLGEPTGQELFCLRATTQAMPLASEVPYNLEEAFRLKVRAFVPAFKRGDTSLGSFLAPGESTASPGVTSITKRWFKGWTAGRWFSGLLILASAGWLAWSMKPCQHLSVRNNPSTRSLARPATPEPLSPPPAAAAPAESASVKRAAIQPVAPHWACPDPELIRNVLT